MQKIGISLLLLFAMINLVPPLFAEGGAFDVTYMHKNECGDLVLMHGLYFDNVYFSILYLGISWLFFTIPFVFDLPKYINRVAFLFSSWNLSILIFEILNMFMPKVILNSEGNNSTYTYYIIFITLGLASITLFESWTKNKRRNY